MVKETDFIAKGFDLYIEVAKRNPELHFTLIGVKEQFIPWIEEKYKLSGIENLEVIFFCPIDKLLKYYSVAKVFVLASITEGIPNSMLEAMLCECIPVGSNVNGIPDVIGDTGILVMNRSVEELDQAVKVALNMNTQDEARLRILQNYSYEKHKKKLLSIVEEILN